MFRMVLVIIRAATCAPASVPRPTSIVVFGLDHLHPILVSPWVIRNTVACMHARGGHRCYIIFSLFSAFCHRRSISIHDLRSYADFSFPHLIHNVLEFCDIFQAE
jgi:hypothetical protein